MRGFPPPPLSRCLPRLRINLVPRKFIFSLRSASALLALVTDSWTLFLKQSAPWATLLVLPVWRWNQSCPADISSPAAGPGRSPSPPSRSSLGYPPVGLPVTCQASPLSRARLRCSPRGWGWATLWAHREAHLASRGCHSWPICWRSQLWLPSCPPAAGGSVDWMPRRPSRCGL